MDKIKTVKIKNPDGSVSEETYTISVDAKDVDMANGKELQETIGTIDIDTDGNIAEQLNILKNNEIKLNKKPYYYNSVADMKADTKLKAGDMAVTLGYYSVNDGGAAEYNIVNNNGYDDFYYEGLNNNLLAKLIIKDIVNVKQFGVKGDNTNETNIILVAFNYAKAHNLKFYFPKGQYIINATLEMNVSHFEMYGDGRGKTILYFNLANATFIDAQAMWLHFHDIQFYGNWSTEQFCIKNVDTNKRSARNLFENLEIRNFRTGISLTNYSDCNVLRNIIFHLVGQCIYIKQNDNGIIEDCVAEPFVNVFCELFQPNACAIRNCLVNTSNQVFTTENAKSTAFIINGNMRGGSGQRFGSSVTIENIHSEYVHQFALIGIGDVSIKDVYIWNHNNENNQHMFHLANISNNRIDNINLNNIVLDECTPASNIYDLYKADWSETSIISSNGKTYQCSINDCRNVKVNGFNGTVNIASKLADNMYSDYEINNNRVTLKNNQLILRNKGIAKPNITANDMSKFNDYLFDRTINANTIFECSACRFLYDPSSSTWKPIDVYRDKTKQGTTINYTPVTQNGTFLLSVRGYEQYKFINFIINITNGVINNATELNRNVLTGAVSSDSKSIEIVSSNYQNPYTICETLIN